MALKDDRDEALEILQYPTTCTDLGSRLYAGRNGAPRLRQAYALPGGRMVRHLQKLGLVERVYPDGWEKRAALYQAVGAKKPWLR